MEGGGRRRAAEVPPYGGRGRRHAGNDGGGGGDAAPGGKEGCEAGPPRLWRGAGGEIATACGMGGVWGYC
eukprot:scaffold7715_cov167-Isochrysis_galbana.AAC.2